MTFEKSGERGIAIFKQLKLLNLTAGEDFLQKITQGPRSTDS